MSMEGNDGKGAVDWEALLAEAGMPPELPPNLRDVLTAEPLALIDPDEAERFADLAREAAADRLFGGAQ